jgi:predicted ATPase
MRSAGVSGGDLRAGAANGLVGRRAELEALSGLLRTARLVTITGAGGVGKTRLALAAAELGERRFRDGFRLVPLSPLAEPALLAHTVAEAIGLTDQTTRPVRHALAEHLADRRMLLVLDSCEHLVAACAKLAAHLLAASPGLTVLATSRQALGAAGERTLRLAPLPLTPAKRLGAPAAEADAITLFARRAEAVHPGFAVGPDNRADVIELCRRLEGLPLAIELAAVHLRGMSPRDLLDRLADRFALLDAGRRANPPRHQRLLTTIGWSHELCAGDERLAWARLSVLPGGFDLEAARAVCCDESLPAEAVRDVLARLADKSILVDDGPPAAGRARRYRMLDTLREYGARWLADLGQTQTVRARMRDHYLHFARRGEQAWLGPDQAGWFARMSLEHANLRAALEQSLGETEQDLETALDLAGTLWFYWVGAGHLAEGRHYLERALEAENSPGVGAVTAKALWVLGYIAVLQGDLPAAISLLIRCRALARVEGDAAAEAYAVHRLGCAALVGDHHSRAAALFTDALSRYSALGELNSNVLMGWIELAMTAAFGGDLERAVDLCEQARALCDEYGERWARSYAIYVLAFAAFTHGERGRAAELARECLRTSHSFHDLIAVVLAMELLALCAATAGSADHAARLQGASGRIWKTVGVPLFGSVYFGAAHQKCRELAHAVLGEHAYHAAYQDGARLDLDAAVARALGDVDEPALL